MLLLLLLETTFCLISGGDACELLAICAFVEEFGGSFVIGKFGSGISGRDSYIFAICLLDDFDIDLPMPFNLFSADINFIGLIGLGLSFKSVNFISGKRRWRISSYNFNRSVNFENSSGFEEAKMETVDELNLSIDDSFEFFFTLPEGGLFSGRMALLVVAACIEGVDADVDVDVVAVCAPVASEELPTAFVCGTVLTVAGAATEPGPFLLERFGWS